ncbi:MAG: lipopolysaccharide assembly protein LapA domain-containing protein [Ignavibacteriales bacterium]
MRFKIILLSVLFLFFAIIASQNTITTELKFLFWSVEAPLIVMIVVIFILGLVIGLIFSSNYERKKKKEELGYPKKTEEKDNISNKSPLS